METVKEVLSYVRWKKLLVASVTMLIVEGLIFIMMLLAAGPLEYLTFYSYLRTITICELFFLIITVLVAVFNWFDRN